MSSFLIKKDESSIKITDSAGDKTVIKPNSSTIVISSSGPQGAKGAPGDSDMAIINDAKIGKSTFVYSGSLLIALNYDDTVKYTDHSVALTYDGSSLSKVVDSFVYNSQKWIYTKILNYNILNQLEFITSSLVKE